MKVLLHRSLGSKLMNKLGVDGKRQAECVEGATVTLPDEIGQKLVEMKVANVADIQGTPKAANTPPSRTIPPATGSSATSSKTENKGS